MPRGACCRSELRRSNDAWLQGMDMEELRSTDRKRSLVTISNFATTPSTQFWENFRRTLIQVGRSVAGHSLATATSSRGETFVLCLQLHSMVTDGGLLCALLVGPVQARAGADTCPAGELHAHGAAAGSRVLPAAQHLPRRAEQAGRALHHHHQPDHLLPLRSRAGQHHHHLLADDNQSGEEDCDSTTAVMVLGVSRRSPVTSRCSCGSTWRAPTGWEPTSAHGHWQSCPSRYLGTETTSLQVLTCKYGLAELLACRPDRQALLTMQCWSATV